MFALEKYLYLPPDTDYSKYFDVDTELLNYAKYHIYISAYSMHSIRDPSIIYLHINNYVYEFYALTAQTRFVYAHKNGLRHGEYLYYDRSGRIAEKTHMFNDRFHGRRELYQYKNEYNHYNRTIIMNAKYGKYHGEYTEYHNDIMIKRTIYQDDEEVDLIETFYYPSGRIEKRKILSGVALSSTSTYYDDEKSTLHTHIEYYYTNEKITNPIKKKITMYYPNGLIMLIENYNEQRQLHGPRLKYSKYKHLTHDEYYINGGRSKCKYYQTNGMPKK